MVSSTQDEILISVKPGKLTFYPLDELKNQTPCELRLSNNTQQPVAFKVTCTNPKKYSVRPTNGLILARSTNCYIAVRMRGPDKKAISGVECKDRFYIMSVVARDVTTSEDIQELFKEPVDGVQETKLRVTYIFPSQTESSKSDGSRANASDVQQMVRFLHVKPQVLTFPFELGKEALGQLLLSNNTLQTVAFKVKTTDPKRYCVQPNIGLILARSTCSVTVRMQGPKESISDIECMDKFLIKNVVAKDGTTTENTWKLFREPVTEDAGEDIKLRVKYVFPSPTGPWNYERARSNDPVNDLLQEWILNYQEVLPRHGHNNGAPYGDLFNKIFVISLLCLAVWFLVNKMLPGIRSLMFLIIMFVIKTINKLVSDSVEEWILKILCYMVVHFISTLFSRKETTLEA